MKNLILIFVFIGSFLQLGNTQPKPVKWAFNYEKVSDTEYTLHFDASINKGWVIYGMEETDGPIPTSINFEEGDFALNDGIVSQSESTVAHDDIFMIELEKFKKEAIFTQNITAQSGTTVTGWVTFMTCDGEKCLPPTDVDFSFDLK
jgi:thiol:disulfide interchange protein DsbD